MSGFAPQLPKPPQTGRSGVVDVFEMNRWLVDVWRILTSTINLTWSMVNKSGSKLTDIETRQHSMLQDVKAWHSGTDTTKEFHISAADGKVWEDHVETLNGNPHGTDHAMLDAVLVLDTTSADTTQDKHPSNAQGQAWQNGAYQAQNAVAILSVTSTPQAESGDIQAAFSLSTSSQREAGDVQALQWMV